MAIGIAVAYALIAMVVGAMLEIFSPPAHLASYWVVLTAGTPAWDYPALLAVNPYFILALPFLPTVFMVLTSAGVGLGMSVAVILGASLLRRRKSASARPAAVGTAAGLTPALIALVTLGACCSTTAAATAGIGLTAQATGTSALTLLANDWYLGVFQLVILYVALLAQEQLLTVYGTIAPTVGGLEAEGTATPPLDRRFAVGAILRVALLAAGVTWCLAMLADWLTVDPATASPVLWAGWLLQHQLVGLTAIVAAMAPGSMYRGLDRLLSSSLGRGWQILLVIAGLSLALGTPPPLAAAGWHGFLNELLGLVGVSSAWGAVSPGLALGPALVVGWAVQYLLLGGFAVAFGLRPRAALRPLLWTAAGGRMISPSSRGATVLSTPAPPAPSVTDGRLPLAPDTQR